MMHLARQKPATVRAFACAAVFGGSVLLSCGSAEDFHKAIVQDRLNARNSIVWQLNSPLLSDSTRDSLVSILPGKSVAQLPGEADMVVLGLMGSLARNGSQKKLLIAVDYLMKCAGSDSVGRLESANASHNLARSALEAALNNQSIDWYTRDRIKKFLANPVNQGSEDAPICCERH